MPRPTATPAPGLSIEVGDSQGCLPGVDRPRLAAIARRVLLAESVQCADISIALVDDATIHRINRRHLDHDEPTDVISFNLSEPDDSVLRGELVVSVETAVREANRDGVEAFTELVLYVVHGLLHLAGLDDLTLEGAAAMRRREGELLAIEGLAHPFSPAIREGATCPE